MVKQKLSVLHQKKERCIQFKDYELERKLYTSDFRGIQLIYTYGKKGVQGKAFIDIQTLNIHNISKDMHRGTYIFIKKKDQKQKSSQTWLL